MQVVLSRWIDFGFMIGNLGLVEINTKIAKKKSLNNVA